MSEEIGLKAMKLITQGKLSPLGLALGNKNFL